MEKPQKPIGRLIATAIVLVASAITTAVILTHNRNTSNPETNSPEQTAAPEPSPAPSRAEQILAGMTLDEKIGQMFIVNAGNLNLNTPPQPGGVIFFADDITSTEQITNRISQLQSSSKYGLFIATDQEGGVVDRLSATTNVTRFPNMADIGATGDPSQAENVGATFGKQMKALGFNIDLAPVSDINTNPNSPAIGVRAFGSDPNLVAKMVAAEVKGLQENGVAATLKHFPGHGDTTTDPHTTSATSDADLARLRQVELIPFQAGIQAGADLVLTAHITLPNIDPSGLPATMSKTIITDLLRDELQFNGIVITDALNMGAISNYYTTEQIVQNSISAGVDILLMPANYTEATAALQNLITTNQIPESRLDQSILRILELKLKLGVIN